jgi:beta-glucanase (GH16 family)
MKAFPLFSFLVALSLGAAPNSGLKPVWEDNFDAKEIDTKKWNVSGPVHIVDGKLQLEVAAKDKPGFWSAGSVDTKGKFSHGQGYFEASIRAIQAKDRGHVTFQIRNADLSKIPSAEMYFWFAGADKVSPNLSFYDDAGKHPLAPKDSPISLDGGKSYKKFVTYGLQWTDKNYIWYVDGRQVHKLSRPTPQEPVYIIINQFIGEGGLLKAYMNPKLGPEPLQVDWVRVFKIP